MIREEIIKQLESGAVAISFTKANGKRRDMVATLDPAVTGQAAVIGGDSQAVFDTGIREWRSFRWDKLTEVAGQPAR